MGPLAPTVRECSSLAAGIPASVVVTGGRSARGSRSSLISRFLHPRCSAATPPVGRIGRRSTSPDALISARTRHGPGAVTSPPDTPWTRPVTTADVLRTAARCVQDGRNPIRSECLHRRSGTHRTTQPHPVPRAERDNVGCPRRGFVQNRHVHISEPDHPLDGDVAQTLRERVQILQSFGLQAPFLLADRLVVYRDEKSSHP